MRVRWTYDDRALQEYEALVAERARRVMDVRPALHVIQHDFHDIEDAVFRTEGRLIRATWRPLNEAWAKWKARRGLSPRMLEMAKGGRIGRLRRAMTVPGAPYQVLRISDTAIEVGTSLGIAKIHQKGGSVVITKPNQEPRSVTIPRRRFVGLRRSDKDRWLGYFAAYIHKGDVHIRRGGV